MSFTVLIVDDEREMCVSLSEILSSHGFDPVFTTDPHAVPSMIREKPIELPSSSGSTFPSTSTYR